MEEHIAYKNHNDEINELINILFENNTQIILYHSHEGYGNTAFIQRVMYLLHTTEKYQIFHAELSVSEHNPFHEAIKKIVCKNGKLYQRFQLFSDNENCSKDIPFIFSSIIKDITQSETLAALLQPQESIPIYAGFYQDRLKQNFFDLVNIISREHRIFFFIDNIQFMDNESLYELQALLQNSKVTLILFETGNGNIFNKFFDEINYKFSIIEISFPEPNINYVKELATLYNKTISDYEAASVLSINKKNIRKILCSIRQPEKNTTNSILEDQLLKIIYLYDDYITAEKIFFIYNYTPYKGIVSKEEINNSITAIENKGMLHSITIFETREKQYKCISHLKISIDIADQIILYNALSDFYFSCIDIDYKHLCQLYYINASLKYIERNKNIINNIFLKALKMGYKIPNDITIFANQLNNLETKVLLATYFFCNANYVQAKNLLEDILPLYIHRSLEVIYAITLNRCRCHKLAEQKLSYLISSSTNIDEKTILVSFLISNHVHNRKIHDAQNLYMQYTEELKISIKYPYFLRNSATLFDYMTAYSLRNSALQLFKSANDFFGYYSTIINMTSYLISHESIQYTIGIIQKAFNELQQYNASQIHLAANNLGVCYLFANDYLNALKYLSLCLSTAKSIMPKGYASVNLSAIFIKNKQYDRAYNYLDSLKYKIQESSLARLKAHYYLQCTLLNYINENKALANSAMINTYKYCSTTENSKIYKAVTLIKKNIENNISYKSEMFSSLYVPCYLEYWTINSIDVLSNDFLPI